MILDRLDPDRLYPARLAGRHAWAAWGLTTHQDDDTVALLVPARDAPGLVPDITARAACQLATPVWPSPTLPTVTTNAGNAGTVDVVDGDRRARLQVVSRAWYLPAGGVPAPGDAVRVDGWPLIDEHSAIRDRFETLAQTSVADTDVVDVTTWVATKAAQVRHGRDVATHIRDVLERLRRTAPDAYQAIGRVVTHARQIHARLPDPARTVAALTLLSAAIDTPSSALHRERIAPLADAIATVRVPMPARSRGPIR